MDYSAANSALWNILIQFGILAAAIIVANILRRKITFFRKSLMPTAVLAGFLLLILRSVGVLRLDNSLLEMTTYHSMADGWYFVLPDGWATGLTVRRVDDVPGERAVILSRLGSWAASIHAG